MLKNYEAISYIKTSLINIKAQNNDHIEKKAMKILFFSHAYSLKKNDKELIKENFFAFTHGPVTLINNLEDAEINMYHYDEIISSEDKDILDFVIDNLKDYSAESLIVFTHSLECFFSHPIYDKIKKDNSASLITNSEILQNIEVLDYFNILFV